MPKQALIILPGWGGSKKTWANFVAANSDTFVINVIEMPCFGDEPCPREVWGVEEYAQFAKDKIEKIVEDSEYVLLGHSFGGQIASYLVGSDMIAPNKLVLIGAAAIRPRNYVRRIVLGSLTKMAKPLFSIPILRSFAGLARKIWYRGVGTSDYNSSSVMARKIYAKVIRQDLSLILPSITVPTSCIWGARDTMTPLRLGIRTSKLIPSAELHVLPNGKHGLHHTHIAELSNILNLFV